MCAVGGRREMTRGELTTDGRTIWGTSLLVLLLEIPGPGQ